MENHSLVNYIHKIGFYTLIFLHVFDPSGIKPTSTLTQAAVFSLINIYINIPFLYYPYVL